MTPTLRAVLAVAAASIALAGCGTTTGSPRSDCTSHYAPLAGARSWTSLKNAIRGNSRWGRVAAVRTQARGSDVGAGTHRAVRVIDLLDSKGERLAQADVWRTDDGGWRAGVWSQCTD